MHALVTGANGHLGYNLCRELLRRGHQVRASVRSLADRSKTERLSALGHIELVEADVLDRRQLRAALTQIDTLFHLAAVYAYVIEPGREDDVMRPSLEGAENAMRAAAEAGTGKVVLTSSIVTLPMTKPGAPPSTEEDWIEDLRTPYIRAKTLAEQRAWALARELKVDLVTVLPGAICGPGFVRRTPSTNLVESIMGGSFRMGIPNLNFPYVDVRDVVNAHIFVAEKPSTGRYAACNDTQPTFSEINSVMREIDPSVPLPLMRLPDFMLGAAPIFDRLNHRLLGTPRTVSSEFIATIRGKVWNASNARIKRELGWKPSTSLHDSLRDTMQTLRENRARAAA